MCWHRPDKKGAEESPQEPQPRSTQAAHTIWGGSRAAMARNSCSVHTSACDLRAAASF